MAQRRRHTAETGTEGYVRDVTKATKAGIARAAGDVEGAAERAAHYVKDARDALVDLRGRTAEPAWANVVRFTKKNPERALVLASLVGVVLGAPCRRSES